MNNEKSFYAEWLKMKYWTVSEATYLFYGEDPNDLYTTMSLGFESHIKKTNSLIQRNFNQDNVAPIDLIKFALENLGKIPKPMIDWYKTAKQNEPIVNDLPAYLDKTHGCYSEELFIAIQAWQAVFSSNPARPKTGSRKGLIGKWLDDNHPKLEKNAKDRITVLLNPDKSGGVSKTE